VAASPPWPSGFARPTCGLAASVLAALLLAPEN